MNPNIIFLLASVHNDAFDDILSSDAFRGAVESISPLISVTDVVFAAFITFIAFFIISTALLRNVVNGAVAAYPTLFDKIDNAKREMSEGKVLGQTVADKSSIPLKALAFFIPNFKAMSDFKDNNIAAKDYFLKAIPQMFCVVMIGVVIYNGYYRDVVSVASNFGSEMIYRVITNADPVKAFDGLVGASGNPINNFDGDVTQSGKFGSGLTKKLYSEVVTQWTDIKAVGEKTVLSNNLENWAREIIEASSPYVADSGWSGSYSVQLIAQEPDISNISAGSNDKLKIFGFTKPVSSFGVSSTSFTEEEHNWHIKVITTFKQKNPGILDTSNKLGSATLVVPINNIKFEEGKCSFSSDGDVFALGNTSKIDGRESSQGKGTVYFEGGTSASSCQSTAEKWKSTTTISGSGSSFKVGNDKYKVTKIKVVDGSGALSILDKDGLPVSSN